ncbi:hypothetical protein [Hydrogenovibrio marinus]|uniref:Uncharacterized protein n=1 Tax=Hydrogenovibrio marinus TaxID=28885 RepID=A0A066ZMA9_HYDMR|nr:hypothetical protein [Hydrogenovibrio marinus]KDN94632.1 hypothetical protein EI16_12080 [Hydrogenovibrio marinus]
MRLFKLQYGTTMPESGLNFIGLQYDPNWMPAFLAFEPNRSIFKTDEQGVGFLIDVRGIISNMWFINLMKIEPKNVVEEVLKVCSACYEDSPERLDRLDDLDHWNIVFEIERFHHSVDNIYVESQYTMYFPQHKPPSAKNVGLFNF